MRLLDSDGSSRIKQYDREKWEDETVKIYNPESPQQGSPIMKHGEIIRLRVWE